MKTVEINQIKTGKNAGQYRFKLVSKGRNIDPRQAYNNKKDLEEMIANNFPNFKLVDNTVKDA